MAAWFRRKRDERKELIEELQRLQIDWALFRDCALKTLNALRLRIPCDQFAGSPSPESFVASADELLDSNQQEAVEFLELVSLAGLEHAIGEVCNDAAENAMGYPYVKLALPATVIKLFDSRSSRCESALSKQLWFSAYLSVRAGLDDVQPLEQAVNSLALAIGVEIEGL